MKTKTPYCTNNVKIEKNEFLKVCFKNRTCYYFDDIVKLEDFDMENFLIDEKSLESILIYDTLIYKTLIVSKPLRIRFDKADGMLELMMELNI